MPKEFDNINRIPVATWRWLKVNDVNLQGDIPPSKALTEEHKEQTNFPEHMTKDYERLSSFSENEERALAFIGSKANYRNFIHIKQNEKQTEPIVIHFQLDAKNDVLYDDIVIVAEADSEAKLIIRYESDKESPVFHAGRVRLIVKAGAKIQLTQSQMFNENSRHISYVIAELDEKADAEINLIELGASQRIGNCRMAINGDDASGRIQSLYLGDKKNWIDLNYKIAHQGKRGIGHINSKGALLDEAYKTFRGTIDFLRGSSGSKGEESEYVALLSDKVKNLSVPLLLCGEDDVEGAHAASAGRLDDEKLFYLTSRGLSNKEAKKLLIEGQFAPIIDCIPDESLRDLVYEAIQERLNHD